MPLRISQGHTQAEHSLSFVIEVRYPANNRRPACRLALEKPEASGGVFNIGSGQNYTIKELAERIIEVMGKSHLEPDINGKYRVGDVRHCFADISLAQRVLGYRPRVTLEKGLIELVSWLEGQVAEDRVDQASAELSARGLTV